MIQKERAGATARLRIVLSALALIWLPPAFARAAERPTTRVEPETAVGGLTVLEEAIRQRQLHDEIVAVMPAGVNQMPLVIEITQRDRDDLSIRAPSGSAPLRVGGVKPVPDNVGKPFGQAFNRGVVEQGENGSFVWALAVSSPGAQAIRLHLTSFSLPGNAEMYLLSPQGQAHGPYVGVGRNGDGDLWTRSIASDTGWVVLRYSGATPDADRPSMSFVIS